MYCLYKSYCLYDKLGGIPVFDNFLEDFYGIKAKQKINFMKPEQDIDSSYVWMIYNDVGVASRYTRFVRTICHPRRGWSCSDSGNDLFNIIIPPLGPATNTPAFLLRMKRIYKCIFFRSNIIPIKFIFIISWMCEVI